MLYKSCAVKIVNGGVIAIATIKMGRMDMSAIQIGIAVRDKGNSIEL